MTFVGAEDAFEWREKRGFVLLASMRSLIPARTVC